MPHHLYDIWQQYLQLKKDSDEYKLEPGEGLVTAKAKDKQEEFISQIINRLYELFITRSFDGRGIWLIMRILLGIMSVKMTWR